MKFMAIIKSPEPSSLGPPPAELMGAIQAFGAEAMQAGVLVEQGGLMPRDAGAAIALDGKGGVTVFDGPFSEAKEVFGGYAVYEVASREEALDWCRRFAELHARFWPGFSGVIEMRQIMDRPGS